MGDLEVRAELFTYGGGSFLWGYSADRAYCGIWPVENPNGPGEVWPIASHAEAWSDFRRREPLAVNYAGPQPGGAPSAQPAAVPPGSRDLFAPTAKTGEPQPEPATGYKPGAIGDLSKPAGKASKRRLDLGDTKVRIGVALVAVVIIAIVVALVTSGGSTPPAKPSTQALAEKNLNSAYNALGSGLTNYKSDATKCTQSPGDENALQCFTDADAVAERAFADFNQALASDRHLVPAMYLLSEKNLATATVVAEGAYSQLASSASDQLYASNLTAVNPTAKIKRFQLVFNSFDLELQSNQT